MRGRANSRWSLGLTVGEVENLRSPNMVNMGIYGLHLIHWFQNGPKIQNRTKIDKLLLLTHGWFSKIQKSRGAYVVKNRQFSSNFDVFAHFGISESNGVRRYPYRPYLVTSKFRPPLLRGRSFSGRSRGLAWPQWPQIWHKTFWWSPTAMVKRSSADSNF